MSLNTDNRVSRRSSTDEWWNTNNSNSSKNLATSPPPIRRRRSFTSISPTGSGFNSPRSPASPTGPPRRGRSISDSATGSRRSRSRSPSPTGDTILRNRMERGELLRRSLTSSPVLQRSRSFSGSLSFVEADSHNDPPAVNAIAARSASFDSTVTSDSTEAIAKGEVPGVVSRIQARCVPLLISYDTYRDPDYDELEHDDLVESEQGGRCIIAGLMLFIRLLNLATIGVGVAIVALGFWMMDFLNENRATMELQMAFMHLVIAAVGVVYLALPCTFGPTVCLTPNLACACLGESGREKAHLISSLLKYMLALNAGMVGTLGVVVAHSPAALAVLRADPVFAVVLDLFDERLAGYNITSASSPVGELLADIPGFSVSCYAAAIVPCLELFLLTVHHFADGIWIGRVTAKEVRRSHVDVKRMVLGNAGTNKLLDQMAAEDEARKRKAESERDGAETSAPAVEALTTLQEIRSSSSAKSRLELKQALRAARLRRKSSMDELAEISKALEEQQDESKQRELELQLQQQQRQQKDQAVQDGADGSDHPTLVETKVDGTSSSADQQSPGKRALDPSRGRVMSDPGVGIGETGSNAANRPKWTAAWTAAASAVVGQRHIGSASGGGGGGNGGSGAVSFDTSSAGPTRARSASVAAAATLASQWACPKCTLHNDKSLKKCVLCEAPRPGSSAETADSFSGPQPAAQQPSPVLSPVIGSSVSRRKVVPLNIGTAIGDSDSNVAGARANTGERSSPALFRPGDVIIKPRQLNEPQVEALPQKAPNKRKRKQRACVSCGDRRRTIVLLPCRHFCLCEQCCDNLQRNPKTIAALRFKRVNYVQSLQTSEERFARRIQSVEADLFGKAAVANSANGADLLEGKKSQQQALRR
eukprot:INCI4809.3.p1 GENE.INCI4809.3~~INCI4809.3.p1  ORF type:complete len:879 (+),score=172.05 INCI4809.3:512-3148(+)